MRSRRIPILTLILITTFTLVVTSAFSVQSTAGILQKASEISSYGLINHAENLPRLHTDGRWVKDQNDNTVFLRGLNKYSLEYRSDGANWVESDWDKFKSWGVNIVRVAFNKAWWDSNIQTADGMLYREKIKQAVDWGKERGIYTIIDMHWWSNTEKQIPMPSDVPAWVNTWGDIANIYKNEYSVLFDIWNEPHDISESLWRDAAQQCVNGIRATGADNIIVVGALNWCRDITFTEDLGHLTGGNIIYSLHEYPKYFSTGYPVTVDGVKRYLADNGWKWLLDNDIAPAIIGEFGGVPTNPVEVEFMRVLTNIANGQENDNTDWRMGYLAWAFNPYDPYQLVETDYVTPTVSGEVLINAIQDGKNVELAIGP